MMIQIEKSTDSQAKTGATNPQNTSLQIESLMMKESSVPSRSLIRCTQSGFGNEVQLCCDPAVTRNGPPAMSALIDSCELFVMVVQWPR